MTKSCLLKEAKHGQDEMHDSDPSESTSAMFLRVLKVQNSELQLVPNHLVPHG